MTTQPFAPSRSSDFRIMVDGGVGIFADMDAVETAIQTTAVFDGGSDEPYVLGGRAAPSEFTLSRPFAYDRDMDVIATYLPKVKAGGVYLTVTVTPTRDGANLGKIFKSRALVTSISTPPIAAGQEGAPTVPNFQIKMRGSFSVVNG